MFSSDSDKNGRINFWMFSGGICASWLMTHSFKSVPEERALTASLPLCCCSLFQMWPSISVGVWLLCRQWSNWSSLTLTYWPKWIFYLTSETLTGNVPSTIKVLESLYEIVYLYLWRPQLLICKGDEWDFPGFSIQMRGFFWRILIFKQHHASRNWIVHLLDLYVSTSTPTILGILEITILCNVPLPCVFLKSFNCLGFTRVWFGYFEVLKNGVVNLRYLYSSISTKAWKTFYLFSRRLGQHEPCVAALHQCYSFWVTKCIVQGIIVHTV